MSNSTSSLEPTSLIESSIMHINSQPKFVTNAIVNALRATSIISSSLSNTD
ncbi:MAG: hypothetical protein IIA82_00965 [Thaumarchaeota archaeon]|nr:hypothetical protein [Nitrososphaerota archaeon]